MKILVTGGAGFIGSHLVERLLQAGHQVVALDDLSTGSINYLEEIKKHPAFTFIQGSTLDRVLLNKLIKECNVIFHLAAVLGVKKIVEDPLKVIEGNIDGTRNVLELAYDHNSKVIFASTSEIYGKNECLPYKEESNRVLGSTSTHRWCYATAKAVDEHLCFAYAQKGLPISIVRYFNAYGPRAVATQYGGVIPKFITSALKGEPITVYGTGEQTRCFTFIDDTVTGTAKCMDSNANGHVFNIGSDLPISINELAKKIKLLTNSDSPIVHIPYEDVFGEGYEDTQGRQPDLSKAKRMLGFYPNIKLEDGLNKTIKWYQDRLESGSK